MSCYNFRFASSLLLLLLIGCQQCPREGTRDDGPASQALESFQADMTKDTFIEYLHQ